MKLRTSEKWRLVGEAFVTAGIIILLYFASYQLFQWFLLNFPGLFMDVLVVGDLVLMLRSGSFWQLNPFLYFVLLVIAILAIVWRLKRRYRQYELRHIIAELHYIAQGNYSHRIRGNIDEDLKPVVDSIHLLVDSTVAAMEEERRVERTKDELITNVSHDIRTPLTSIIGYLGLIEQGHYKSDAEARNYVHTAYQKARQMKIMVDDLFEYTTLRDKGQEVEFEMMTFDMIHLIQQLVTDFQLQTKTTNLDLSIQTREEHVMMKGNPEKLVRVFSNLLTNAFKYGKGGTEIVIEVTRQNEDLVEIVVRNNGQAISEEALPHLFDRFYRAEESRTESAGNSGLGLAIAKNIVEMHCGEIRVTSDEYWTKFIVTLPTAGR